MAEKRMFAKSIVLSDAFLDMPATARCLYFTMSMLADDDGFVDSPKAIMRQCMASDDDLKLLIAKFFIIPFESGIVVIRHWRVNNYLRSDRYIETKHLDEKALLQVEKNGVYKCDGLKKATREIIETEKKTAQKKRQSLLEREPKNDLEKVEKLYLENYKELHDAGILKSEKPIVNWTLCRKLESDCLKKFGLRAILEAVKKSKANKFAVSKGYALSTILSAGVLAQLINSTDGRIDNDSEIGEIDF